MQTYEVHFFTDNPGDGVHLHGVSLPIPPQIGYTIIVKEVTKRPHIGIVTDVVMRTGDNSVTVFIQEKNE